MLRDLREHITTRRVSSEPFFFLVLTYKSMDNIQVTVHGVIGPFKPLAANAIWCYFVASIVSREPSTLSAVYQCR